MGIHNNYSDEEELDSFEINTSKNEKFGDIIQKITEERFVERDVISLMFKMKWSFLMDHLKIQVSRICLKILMSLLNFLNLKNQMSLNKSNRSKDGKKNKQGHCPM